MPDDADLIRSLYGTFSRGDLETVAGMLSEDFVAHQPGRNPLPGDYEGVEAMLGLLRTLAERSGGTFRAEVHDVLVDDDHAVGLLRVSGRRVGRTVDMPVVHVWHVRDGKIAELWIHPQDQYAIDEFWA